MRRRRRRRRRKEVGYKNTKEEGKGKENTGVRKT